MQKYTNILNYKAFNLLIKKFFVSLHTNKCIPKLCLELLFNNI